MAVPVLIADDSRTMSEYLSSILRKLGFDDIEVTADGKEALKLISTKPYAFIVLDQNMPNMSGLDILRGMKQSKLAVGTPVMMVTGAANATLVAAIRNEGLPVSSMIAKPFSLDVFRQKFAVIARYIRDPGERVGQTDAEPLPSEGLLLFNGSRMKAKVVKESSYTGIAFKGHISYDDRLALKHTFDAAIASGSPIVGVNMGEVDEFDEFFLGFFLMFAGTLASAGRQVYLITGANSRMVQVGVDKIVTAVNETSAFYEIVGLGSPAAAAP